MSRRPVMAVIGPRSPIGPGSGGWADRLAGQPIDDRREGVILSVSDPEQAVAAALAVLSG